MKHENSNVDSFGITGIASDKRSDFVERAETLNFRSVSVLRAYGGPVPDVALAVKHARQLLDHFDLFKSDLVELIESYELMLKETKNKNAA